ncbi:MAG: Crp/Fnr family transcriptional regulator [Gammaproteobacteria bacterium]|nr:Crp/Fnr family transcriptional regulator [Gammaproteobacteria bacterium]MCW9004707.1 Crp/Fnr family transcriptional regulator [Gammaproteobacteria bacterium]MCW9055112.1 Crp/Fnr family transcriptional regulator [Gammaproteobacteria bacterium]
MHMSPPSVANSELHQLSLMSQLSNSQLNKIQKTIKLVRLTEGEHLFEQGQEADKFYLVRSGQIKLFRVSMEGSERVIDIIQPGQIFAESVLFLNKGKYPIGAEALLNTELLSFDFKTFRSVLEESKDTCFQLMSDMSQCLHQYLDQVDYLTLQNASFRLINYLLQQVPEDHQPDKSYVIQLTTSKSVIASWLSIQPETFSRILRTLKNRKLIDVNGKSITVHNVNQLKDMAA